LICWPGVYGCLAFRDPDVTGGDPAADLPINSTHIQGGVMSWRFRRRVTLFPGVRVNLSRRGISTTFGIPGASINVGPQGTYFNAGIPGTGIYNRTRLGGSTQDQQSLPEAPPESEQDLLFMPSEIGAIKSADNETIISPGLRGVRETLWAARKERDELTVQLDEGRTILAKAERRLSLIQHIPFHRSLLKKKLAESEEEVEGCTTSVDAIYARLKECKVSLTIDLDVTLAPLYDKMKAAFDELRKSAKQWDITSSVTTDMKRERTAAYEKVTRSLVNLKPGRLDFVKSDLDAMQLVNANGADLYLYPAFLLVFRSFHDFALVDILDFDISYSDTRFQEEEGVPGDSTVIGKTWRYVNKNGTPDRRFSDNYEIPVALYGEVRIRSEKGLNEAYMFSNAAAAKNFAQAFAEFKGMLSSAGSTRVN
jgi:hypothetical protein